MQSGGYTNLLTPEIDELDLTDPKAVAGFFAAETLLNYPDPCFLNLGTGVDVTIRELAETVKDVVGYEGGLVYDSSKPDGTNK